tara:strand:+ start:299 stop:1576 length:1278 start_codon:yes stop_codon:yes gene_type:complete
MPKIKPISTLTKEQKKLLLKEYINKRKKKESKERIKMYAGVEKRKKKTKELLAKQAIERLKERKRQEKLEEIRKRQEKLEEIRKRKEKAKKFDFTKSFEGINLTNQEKRKVGVDKISDLFLGFNIKRFGNKKVKNLSKFQKELIKISKEKDDKKYLQMVIELLIGSGLLITAIILLLIFLYNPKNNQITFDNTGNNKGNNTGNNNNRRSLAEKARNYRNNEEKLNERIKPTHYRKTNGKNFFFNTVNKKFNIPSKKHAIIVKKFEAANGIDIVNIKTVGHYNSLALITKRVMNDNTKVEKNLDKRRVKKEVDLTDIVLPDIVLPDELKEEVDLVLPVSTKRKIVKVKKKENIIKKMARRTVKRLTENKKSPSRENISVILKKGEKPSPNSIQQIQQIQPNRKPQKNFNILDNGKSPFDKLQKIIY